MSISLYPRIGPQVQRFIDPAVKASTQERVVLLVLGIIGSKSVSPAKIAKAIKSLGLSDATQQSVERRVRRIENDPDITAALCFHRAARQRLRWGKPRELRLAIDPTSQDDRVVMLTVSVWYRGRALPLAWAVWPANQPLKGPRFWERVAALLAIVAELLPPNVAAVWLADRAFGTPQFTDLVTAYGWEYIVRVQGQTRCRDRMGQERTIRRLVQRKRERHKLRGQAFKKRGWRDVTVLVYWGKHHETPLCLVTSLGAHWEVLYLYRQRYTIEAFFRDCKSAGWQWEKNQVTDLAHTERLLVGLALATWLTVGVGTQVAAEALARPATPRHTRPDLAKYSLFTLGLDRLHEWWAEDCRTRLAWTLSEWDAPNWSGQLYAHHSRAFVFHPT
ncbi:MAG: transposase, partial [Anaerolineaceae bacterium]|nr:transposase [Anaerolineaceae bacterium]